MHQTLQQDKFEDADFKHDNNIFKFHHQIQKSSFFGPKFKNFYFFPETLQQGKIEGADFKYDNGFSKLQPKKTQTRHF